MSHRAVFSIQVCTFFFLFEQAIYLYKERSMSFIKEYWTPLSLSENQTEEAKNPPDSGS